MHTIQLTVGPDGRVEIPDTRPGEIITIQIATSVELSEQLTLATARTDEERAAVVAEIKRLARELRRELPESWLTDDHGDLLYGDDGLPA